jgi:hypothetical protein
VPEQAREARVLLPREHRHHVRFGGEARAARVQPHEVRHEEDRGPIAQRLQVLQPLQAHQAHDPLAPRPPQDAALDEAPREGAKVRARQALARRGVHVREAPLEVDARHAPALGDQPVERAPEGVAERRLRAERQEVHEPHEREDQPAHDPGGGGAPGGRL